MCVCRTLNVPVLQHLLCCVCFWGWEEGGMCVYAALSMPLCSARCDLVCGGVCVCVCVCVLHTADQGILGIVDMEEGAI